MENGAQRLLGDAERDDAGRMAVDHRVDVGAHLVDLAVDEALAIDRAAARIDRIAVEIEGDEVAHRHVARRDRLHLQIAVGVARIPDADMAERVEHAVVRQDVVGGDQIERQLGIEIGVVGVELGGLGGEQRRQCRGIGGASHPDGGARVREIGIERAPAQHGNLGNLNHPSVYPPDLA